MKIKKTIPKRLVKRSISPIRKGMFYLKYFSPKAWRIYWTDNNRTFDFEIWRKNNPKKQLTLQDVWCTNENK